MNIDELIAKVKNILSGIDRTETDPSGGFWQTEDGARIGKIILRDLLRFLRENWPEPAPTPSRSGEAQALEHLQELVSAINNDGSVTDAQQRLDRLVQALSKASLFLAIHPPENDRVPAAEGEAQELTLPEPDFRALCFELVEKLDELIGHYNVPNKSAMIERALAALAQRQSPAPVLTRERPWKREGWLDQEGRCWMGDPGGGEFIPSWRLCRPENALRMIWSLPHWAISVPTPGDAS